MKIKLTFCLFAAFSMLFSCSSDSTFDQKDIEETLMGYAWEISSITSETPVDLNEDGSSNKNLMLELPNCTVTYLFCEMHELEENYGGDCETKFSTLGGWGVDNDTLEINRIERGTERKFKTKLLEEDKFVAVEDRLINGNYVKVKFTFTKNKNFISNYSFLKECQK